MTGLSQPKSGFLAEAVLARQVLWLCPPHMGAASACPKLAERAGCYWGGCSALPCQQPLLQDPVNMQLHSELAQLTD